MTGYPKTSGVRFAENRRRGWLVESERKKKSPARLERTVPWQGLTINLSGISFFYIPAEPLSGTSLEIIEPLCFSKHYLSP